MWMTPSTPGLANRVSSVEQNVHENLIDLPGSAIDLGDVSEFPLDLDVGREFVSHQAYSVFNAVVDLDGLKTAAVELGELPKLGYGLGNPGGGLV